MQIAAPIPNAAGMQPQAEPVAGSRPANAFAFADIAAALVPMPMPGGQSEPSVSPALPLGLEAASAALPRSAASVAGPGDPMSSLDFAMTSGADLAPATQPAVMPPAAPVPPDASAAGLVGAGDPARVPLYGASAVVEPDAETTPAVGEPSSRRPAAADAEPARDPLAGLATDEAAGQGDASLAVAAATEAPPPVWPQTLAVGPAAAPLPPPQRGEGAAWQAGLVRPAAPVVPARAGVEGSPSVPDWRTTPSAGPVDRHPAPAGSPARVGTDASSAVPDASPTPAARAVDLKPAPADPRPHQSPQAATAGDAVARASAAPMSDEPAPVVSPVNPQADAREPTPPAGAARPGAGSTPAAGLVSPGPAVPAAAEVAAFAPATAEAPVSEPAMQTVARAPAPPSVASAADPARVSDKAAMPPAAAPLVGSHVADSVQPADLSPPSHPSAPLPAIVGEEGAEMPVSAPRATMPPDPAVPRAGPSQAQGPSQGQSLSPPPQVPTAAASPSVEAAPDVPTGPAPLPATSAEGSRATATVRPEAAPSSAVAGQPPVAPVPVRRGKPDAPETNAEATRPTGPVAGRRPMPREDATAAGTAANGATTAPASTPAPQVGALTSAAEQPAAWPAPVASAAETEAGIELAPRSTPADVAAGIAAMRRIAEAVSSTPDAGRLELRLDPPELGRVSIDLVLDEGRITATVAAERPETLELMRRHADTLQRDLLAAGFGRADVGFSDRAPQGQGFAPREDDAPPPPAPAAPDPLARRFAPRGTGAAGRLDIRL